MDLVLVTVPNHPGVVMVPVFVVLELELHDNTKQFPPEGRNADVEVKLLKAGILISVDNFLTFLPGFQTFFKTAETDNTVVNQDAQTHQSCIFHLVN